MQRRWTAVTAAWVAVVLIAGVVAATTWQEPEPTARVLIARLDRFVAKSPSYQFAGRGDSVTVMGRAEGGRRISAGYTIEGSFEAGVTRQLVIADDQATELIQGPDRVVFRSADKPGQLPKLKWQALDVAGELADVFPVMPKGAGAQGILSGDLGARALASQVIRHDAGLPVVRFHLAPDDGDGLPGVVSSETELTMARDGTPRRVVTRLRAEMPKGNPSYTVESSTDFRLSDWGKPVGITFPADADIDATPDIDEEAIAAFRDAPVLQPRGIPAGWVLDYASVLSKDETEEGCPEVELDYIDPDDPDFGYLYLYELAASCADTALPRRAVAFRAGAYQGWILVDVDDGTTAQIIAGRTAIQVETDLSPRSLARVLSDLVALDLTKPPIAIPAI